MTDRDATPVADRQVVQGVLAETQLMPPSVLEAITRSELDIAITTARKFPRSLAHFKAQALSYIRLDKETAAASYYVLPRRERQEDGTWKRKDVKGPTVRLAEITGSCWGNVRSGARVIAETDREVVAQGYCHDLESNYAVVTETRRRIVDRHGRRYSDDLVILTANAACAIARRNATFAVIPRVFIDELVAVAMKVAAGEAKTLRESRSRALAAFAELGVTAEQLCDKLERPGLDDVDLEDLAILHGLLTAIKDNETTVGQEFPAPPGATAEQPPSASAALTERLRRRRGETRGDPAQSEPPPVSAPPAPPAPEEPPKQS
jgi:hypothetical protein